MLWVNVFDVDEKEIRRELSSTKMNTVTIFDYCCDNRNLFTIVIVFFTVLMISLGNIDEAYLYMLCVDVFDVGEKQNEVRIIFMGS